ncbi:DMT family transporter [Variovorax sp. RB2P76]|jgi:drug/metabolite transporter (DMT)-like permease|uniref:DMT family transporter n=1 Tax=Variovorax sp. RB2P76 TaxID=3443736 RepID=UPI003F456FD5
MSTPPQHLSRHAPLTALTVLLLLVPPLLWASNAVVGRMVRDLVSPVTLNFVRWIIAFVLLLPLAAPVLRRGSPLWAHWKRYAVLGLLGIGLYNAFQYLALQTSTPINTTLVGSSLPLWMLAVGTLFFGARVNAREIGGALLSMAGVLLVLSRGEWRQLLGLRLVPGDLYMIAGTIAWAFYSWLLARTHEPKAVRQDWAAFLMAQLVFGLAWSGALAAGEWTLTDAHIDMGWPLAAAMLFIGIGPALVAYRCWGTGVQRAGPQAASVFMNLTPLFAAVLSAAFLREPPHWYHGVAFLLIVGGIVVAARR